VLTNPIAKALYNRFSSSSEGFTARNLSLAAKCALMTYRKCGRAEAQAFIDGIRMILTFDATHESLRAGDWP